MRSLARRYWPTKVQDRRTEIASQRALAVFCILSGCSGLAVTILNLEYVSQFGLAIAIGGIASLICLFAPVWINADSKFLIKAQIVGGITLGLLGALAFMSNHLVSPNNLLLVPFILTFTLAVGWRYGLFSLLGTLAIYGWTYAHAPPELRAIPDLLDLETMLAAMSMTAVFVFVGATIFRREMIRVADELLAAQRAAETSMMRFREQAATDALTGITNRGAFDELLAIELDQHRATQKPLCLIMFDLDHFKQVNDTHGHSAGDRVLVETARITASCLRPTDTLARLGGEEFGVVLPRTSVRDAGLIAERIRQALAGLSLTTLSGDTITVTASFGLSERDEAGSAEQISDLLERCDQRLYEAKRGGRNQVCGPQGRHDQGIEFFDTRRKRA